jgi:hypothetical protein
MLFSSNFVAHACAGVWHYRKTPPATAQRLATGGYTQLLDLLPTSWK